MKKLHGVHLAHHKNTENSASVPLPLPKLVRIPMSMHIGAPCTPLVKPRDTVLVGQKIGRVRRLRESFILRILRDGFLLLGRRFGGSGGGLRRLLLGLLLLRKDERNRLCLRMSVRPLSPIKRVSSRQCGKADWWAWAVQASPPT